ncbi:type II toxin-antitoxin system YafQ family toxin [Arcobacter sp.]|uniref:type II toxin-antitoxin system RelE/ParE family toxin n=1 Tax=unclassified Arcobacter TaxID=2593671 RepID=UPI003B009395
MTLFRHKKFINDLKKANLSNSQFEKMIKYFNLLLEEKELPTEAIGHPLNGEWKDFREFHLGGDMLVIYHRSEDKITLARIGTHSQLFK